MIINYYIVKCHLYIGRWAEVLQYIFLQGSFHQRIVNATCQALTSIINASCQCITRVDNASCQCSTRVDLEILFLVRGFEMRMRMNSIPDILDLDFGGSAL
jgi:hypothetical protein